MSETVSRIHLLFGPLRFAMSSISTMDGFIVEIHGATKANKQKQRNHFLHLSILTPDHAVIKCGNQESYRLPIISWHWWGKPGMAHISIPAIRSGHHSHDLWIGLERDLSPSLNKCSAVTLQALQNPRIDEPQPMQVIIAPQCKDFRLSTCTYMWKGLIMSCSTRCTPEHLLPEELLHAIFARPPLRPSP